MLLLLIMVERLEAQHELLDLTIKEHGIRKSERDREPTSSSQLPMGLPRVTVNPPVHQCQICVLYREQKIRHSLPKACET